MSRPFLVAAVFVIGLAVVLAWASRRVVQRLSTILWANAPRAQSLAFVYTLRDLAFRDPVSVFSRLCAEDHRVFLMGVWKEVGWKVARARMKTDPPDPAMLVRTFGFRDGRILAVVCMPPPQRWHEPYFLGVVLPADESLRDDLVRARLSLRFFVLNRGSGDSSRDTDLCAWTADKNLLTYNVGAPKTPEGFAQAVEAKLLELGQ